MVCERGTLSPIFLKTLTSQQVNHMKADADRNYLSQKSKIAAEISNSKNKNCKMFLPTTLAGQRAQ